MKEKKTKKKKSVEERGEEMKRERERQRQRREMKEKMILLKNVSNQKKPPDELAQNVSKNPFRTNYSSFFFERSESYRVFQ